VEKIIKDGVRQFVQEYNELCERVAQGRPFYPVLDKESARITGQNTFVDFVDGKYYYGHYERGVCSIAFVSDEKDEVMYYPIYAAINRLAWDYENAHRVHYADFQMEAKEGRITAFKIQIQYMKSINIDWAKRVEDELMQIASRDGFSIS
jgi:hypothetical protein